MDSIIGQVSNPVFLHVVFVFLFCASIFACVIGAGLALRIPAMLRFFAVMNRWVSTRKMMKPLMVPHAVEPVLLKRPTVMGIFIIAGATITILFLKNVEAEAFKALFFDSLSYGTAIRLASYIKWLLIIGNGLCILVGLLMIFSPHRLSTIEAYTDMWYSLRKHTLPLDKMHYEVDNWIMAHPTVAGVTLIILSLGLGALTYSRI